jgi:hypothetical protein
MQIEVCAASTQVPVVWHVEGEVAEQPTAWFAK